jgi:hypothetical protein
VNTFEPKQKLYPIVSGADAGYSRSDEGARYCLEKKINANCLVHVATLFYINITL